MGQKENQEPIIQKATSREQYRIIVVFSCFYMYHMKITYQFTNNYHTQEAKFRLCFKINFIYIVYVWVLILFGVLIYIRIYRFLVY